MSNHRPKTDALQIIPIPAFEDNYIWLIHQGDEAIIVDPGDAEPVMKALQNLHLSLNAILITHHHNDHIGGVNHLIQQFPHCRVYAPSTGGSAGHAINNGTGHYDFQHIAVGEEDQINIALQSSQSNKNFTLSFNIIALPGHTLDHIAYVLRLDPVLNTQEAPWLFCGDTLFGAGCGRLFEGTPQQMLSSLKKLVKLPHATKVFCTHEYTLKNIAFALTVDPQNQALIARKLETQTLRKSQQPSLPSTMALELATNPFLRCDAEEIKRSMNNRSASELETFTQLRSLRNGY